MFLSHNSRDKPAVEALAYALLDAGVRPWLDKWDLEPGLPWQKGIVHALRNAQAVVVCIGAHGIGHVQDPEVEAALDRAWHDRSRRVIPVFLADAPANAQLPDFLALRVNIDFRKDSTGAEMRRLVAAVAGHAPGPTPRPDSPSPYLGLPPFEETDAPRFFGREGDIVALLTRLAKGERLLTLVGGSGTGKSSLLRAGLIPAVRTGQLDGRYDWQVLVLRPGPRPVHELAVQLTKVQGGDTTKLDDLKDRLRQKASTLSNEIDLWLAGTPSRLLLAVDQFEEGFTQARDADERRAFIENVLHAVSVAGGRTTMVITLRVDFMGRALEESRPLAEALKASQDVVLPMRPEQLRAAIERPALQARLRFDDGLVDTLVDGVKDQPGDLPLLQFTLLELWRRREGTRLTWAAYSAIGGVRGAIAKRAEAFLTATDLDDAKRSELLRVLGRLVQLGDGTVDTQRRVPRSELESLGSSSIGVLLDRLIDERLLSAGEAGVEVAHEALIREWRTLREWIDADREVLRIHHELSRDARRWAESGRSEEDLWRGFRLARAIEPLDTGRLKLSGEEQEFMVVSRVVERRERRWRRAGRLAKKLVQTAAIAVVATVAANESRLGWAGFRLPQTLDWHRISAPESGQFPMGCVSDDRECQEEPRHWVSLTHSFELMSHEVTVDEYRRFAPAGSQINISRWLRGRNVLMGTQPEWSKLNHPVVNVTWSDATEFCKFVGGRMPTEAEWEFAARGKHGDWVYPWGSVYSQEQANGAGVGGRDTWNQTAPVKSFPPNDVGLYDMAGNVWEWTSTAHRRYPYRSDDGREDPGSKEGRVVRGGSFFEPPWRLRVSGRHYLPLGIRSDFLGFRCARDISS